MAIGNRTQGRPRDQSPLNIYLLWSAVKSGGDRHIPGPAAFHLVKFHATGPRGKVGTSPKMSTLPEG